MQDVAPYNTLVLTAEQLEKIRALREPVAYETPGLKGRIRPFPGEPGSGKVQREYSFILNDRFIHIVNRSLYPPQAKNPKGEKHEDIGFFNYDKFTKKFVLRQFRIEGFVTQFAAESI